MLSRRGVAACFTAAVVISAGIGAGVGTALASSPGTVLCTDNPCVITMANNGQDGLRITEAAGPLLEHPLLITDPAGIPELWQGVNGLFEGPAGEICTTDRALAGVVCLTSDGTGGTVTVDGQVLTAADIEFLHDLMAAGKGVR